MHTYIIYKLSTQRPAVLYRAMYLQTSIIELHINSQVFIASEYIIITYSVTICSFYSTNKQNQTQQQSK